MRFGTLAIVMLGVVGCGPEDAAEMVTSKVVLTENLFGAEPVALPGVDVFIDDAEGNRTVLTTDAAGEAEWEMDAELGPVDVTIWGANNDAIVSLLEMPLGGDPIRWRYRRAAPQQITLSGEVIDGKWGSGALVSAFGQQRYWNLDVETDPDSWTYSLGVEPGQPARLLFTRSEFTWNGSSHDAERRYTLIDVPASDTSHTVDVDLTSMAETTTHAGTMPLPQGRLSR